MANRPALCRQLGLPHDATDRRVLLGLYERHHHAAAQRILGTFAWMLWDGDRHELIAVRDRMGMHDLYYAAFADTVLAATRMDGLLESLPKRPARNPRSIVTQIHGYAPFAGETFYEGVHAVEPGSVLMVSRDRIRQERYWRIQPEPLLKLSSNDEYAEALRALLFQVVTEYMPTAQLGITLSGGLDSTSVAAAVHAATPGKRPTAISWSCPELPSADETPYSSAVAAHLDMPVVTIRADLHWPLGSAEGAATTAATPSRGYYKELWDTTFAAMKERDLGAAFSGISGDHLFGGNVFAYPDLLLTGRWRDLVRQLRANLPYAGMTPTQAVRRMVIAPLVSSYLPRWQRLLPLPVSWLGEEYRDLYWEYVVTDDKPSYILPGRQQRLTLLRDPLIPAIASQLNSQAADFGIDLRHPLLDHRLVEFAAGLPTTQTFHAGTRKIIVRNAMRNHLPNKVLDFRGKIYPSAIARRGLKEREQHKVWRLITDMRADELGFVEEARLQQHYRDYLAGEQQGDLFWHTLTLEDWLRRHF